MTAQPGQPRGLQRRWYHDAAIQDANDERDH